MRDRFPRILIVDDEPQSVRLLQAILVSEGYIIQSANSGKDALASIVQWPPDLVLLDALMPDMNGFQVARQLKANPETAAIPVIMVTSLVDRHFETLGLAAGAMDFLTKPVDRFELSIRIRNLLRLKEYGDLVNNHNRLLKQQVSHQTLSLRQSYLETIFALTRASKHKDEETGAHVQRISYYCKLLAERLGMDSLYVDNIYYASPMHDIGKIGIPDSILLKLGKHTAEEFEIMKRHCVLGAEILGSSTSPYLEMGAEIALSHHERWDGSGYPNALKGEAIPLSGRIMSICDVYDALRSKRPYKPRFDHKTAIDIITNGDGRTKPTHFDPSVLNAFKMITEEIREIFDNYEDTHESQAPV